MIAFALEGVPDFVAGFVTVAACVLVPLAIEWLASRNGEMRGNVRKHSRKPRPVPSPELSPPDVYEARDGVRLYRWGPGVRWPSVETLSPQANADDSRSR